jgi:hypothetical protein
MVVVVVGADDPEETMVSEEAMVPEVFIAKISESPDKDSETTILRRYADARLAVGSLEAMGRGSTCGREEPEQERETREGSDQPYFDMHW